LEVYSLYSFNETFSLKCATRRDVVQKPKILIYRSNPNLVIRDLLSQNSSANFPNNLLRYAFPGVGDNRRAPKVH